MAELFGLDEEEDLFEDENEFIKNIPYWEMIMIIN